MRVGVVRVSGDEGVALPMVLGTMFILTAFLLASLALALNNIIPARADQDSKAALAAAQAGIDEYISQLSASGGQYWANGGVDANNPAFDAVPATQACDGGGRRVPGIGFVTARFCYRVLTPKTVTAAEGYIDLVVMGSSTPPGGGRTVSRTLTTRLRPEGFIDFVYFTDVEVLDPVLLDSPAGCAKYYYDGRDTEPGCTEIRWAPNDEVDGPLHSNDALQVQGSVWFKNPRTESSWPEEKGGDPDHLWWGNGKPDHDGFDPVYAAKLPLPIGNQELLKYVQPKVDTNPNPIANRPGCLYTGATRIKFIDASMEVLSPNTTNAPAHCLNASNRSSEQTLLIPPVIYVKPAGGTCTDVGYPRPDELTDRKYVTTTDYNPCRGTAFVEGNVAGRVTVSAEDDVVVVADVSVQDRNGTDVVGLVAGNYVWIYHPMDKDDYDPTCIEPNCPNKGDFENMLDDDDTVNRIDAAILSLRHSMLVQNWDMGDDLDELTIYGALAQKFRGPVGSSGGPHGRTGYDKDYLYDKRLSLLQPPFFLAPESAPWRSVQVTDG
jgi:hypothetical protein